MIEQEFQANHDQWSPSTASFHNVWGPCRPQRKDLSKHNQRTAQPNKKTPPNSPPQQSQAKKLLQPPIPRLSPLHSWPMHGNVHWKLPYQLKIANWKLQIEKCQLTSANWTLQIKKNAAVSQRPGQANKNHKTCNPSARMLVPKKTEIHGAILEGC